MNRRVFLTSACAAVAGSAFPLEIIRPVGVPLSQEPLKFEFGALAPYLDEATLRWHYRNCHAESAELLRETLDQASIRVDNVVSLMPCIQSMMQPTDYRSPVVPFGRKLGPLSATVQDAIREHGGAHVNHTIFWRFLAPEGSVAKKPMGPILSVLERDFGGLKQFKKAFKEAALGLFGSGWAWLVYRPDGRLVIATTPNEDNPLMQEFVSAQIYGRPLLALDLWEHAYYEKYRNDREAYIDAWWHVVNWSFVDRAYAIVTSNRL